MFFLLFLLPTTSAVVFIPKGDLVFTAGEWIVNVDLHVEELSDALREVYQQYKTFESLSRKLMNGTSANSSLVLQDISREYAVRLQHEIIDISSILSSFGDGYSDSYSFRSSRGLIDAIGHGLHFLAGTATDDQIRELQKEISRLAVNTEESFNSRITFLSNVTDTLRRHGRLLSESTKALLILQKHIHKVEEAFTDSLTASQSMQKIFGILHITFLAISDHITELRDGISRIKNIVMLAELGKLTPSILSPSQLSDILKNARSRFTSDLEFLAYDGKSVFLVYGVAQVLVMRQPHRLALLITLPLYHRRRTFNIFKAHAFPSLHPDGQHSIIIEPDSPYLGVSRERNQFVLLPEGYSTNCKRAVVEICPPIFPLHTNLSSSCSISVYANNTQQIGRNCEIRLTRARYALYTKGLYPGQWVYSVNPNASLVIACPHKISRVSIMGHGMLVLPPGCSASDEYIYLELTSNSFNSSFSIDANVSIEPLPAISFNISEPKLLSVVKDLEDTFSSIEKLNTHKVPTMSVPKVSKNIRIIEPLERNIDAIRYSGLSVSVLVCALGIAASWCFCKKAKSRSHRELSFSPVHRPINIYNTSAVSTASKPLFPNIQDVQSEV